MFETATTVPDALFDADRAAGPMTPTTRPAGPTGSSQAPQSSPRRRRNAMDLSGTRAVGNNCPATWSPCLKVQSVPTGRSTTPPRDIAAVRSHPAL